MACTGIVSRCYGLGLWFGAPTDRGEDEEHHAHPYGANDEGLATAVVLDNIQSIESTAKVDTVQNHLSHVTVVDAGGLEDDRSVVEELIHVSTCPEIVRLEGLT